MKQWHIPRYGGPEVLTLRTLPEPTPGKGQVRIRVKATTINRTDCGFLLGKPYIARLFGGLPTPRYQALGSEFAGIIDAVGPEVNHWAIGDRVYGYNDAQFGGHSECMLFSAAGNLVRIPEGMSYIQAAPLTEGGHYALCNLKAAHVGPNSTTMVYGATGAIGSAAVQLAKVRGAHVTAFCAGAHMELVQRFQPDALLDYQTTPLSALNQQVDFFFDSVGKRSFGEVKHLLKGDGIYISTELGPRSENPFRGLLGLVTRGKRVLFPIPFARRHELEWLGQCAANGQFTPLVDRVIPFEDIPDGFRYVLTGQKLGNVVVAVAPDAHSTS
jgi:NADPH:quinone reductase-like Zn-dependent oxidoreductase